MNPALNPNARKLVTAQLPPTDGLYQVWIAGQFHCEGSELTMRQSLKLYQSRGKQARLRLPSGAWEDTTDSPTLSEPLRRGCKQH